jgi:phosphoenolpyruvate-protein phosphotransferase (PTS system enzyme I)
VKVFRGTSVSEGVAAGEALVLLHGEVQVQEATIAPSQRLKEIAKLKRALAATKKDIERLEEETRDRIGDLSRLLTIYQTFLDDSTIVTPIIDAIRHKNLSAQTALHQVLRGFVDRFLRMGEPFANYAPELLDLERRVQARLLGNELVTLSRLKRPVVIIADELAPMQALAIDREKVLAFATETGSPESHTAILARHLGIPAVTGLRDLTKNVGQHARVIIDGLEGSVIVDPDRETAQRYAKVIRGLTRERHLVAERMPYQVATADGVPIEVLCNIDTAEGAHDLAEAGYAGVGLFRTEFLYIGRTRPPDENTQSAAYTELLKAFGSRPVVIRTMDFGADKFDDRVSLHREANPALGLRSIRLSFEREDLFRAQLRAILRASVHGAARIMFPMITDLAEFRQARAIVDSVKAELTRKRVRFAPSVPVGAMIELPAAVLEAGHLLGEADFLSVGSNDLIQYTLGVDRTNGRVAHLYRPYHPAVCRLIGMTVEAGVAAKKPISLCGEMAGNPRYVPLLIGLGVRTFSMAPARVGPVIDLMRRVQLSDCEALAQAALAARDPGETWKLIEAFDTGKHERRKERVR